MARQVRRRANGTATTRRVLRTRGEARKQHLAVTLRKDASRGRSLGLQVGQRARKGRGRASLVRQVIREGSRPILSFAQLVGRAGGIVQVTIQILAGQVGFQGRGRGSTRRGTRVRQRIVRPAEAVPAVLALSVVELRDSGQVAVLAIMPPVTITERGHLGTGRGRGSPAGGGAETWGDVAVRVRTIRRTKKGTPPKVRDSMIIDRASQVRRPTVTREVPGYMHGSRGGVVCFCFLRPQRSVIGHWV